MTKQEYQARFKEVLARIRADRGDRPRYARRLPYVIQTVGLGRTQIFDAVKRGVFPKPFKITAGGRAVAIDDDELLAHQEVMRGAREQQP